MNSENIELFNNIDKIYIIYKKILKKIDINENSPFNEKIEIYYKNHKHFITSNIFSEKNSYFYVLLNNLYSLLQYLSYTLEGIYFKYLNIKSIREDYLLKRNSIFKQYRTYLSKYRISVSKKEIPKTKEILEYLYIFDNIIDTTKYDKSHNTIYNLIINEIQNKDKIIAKQNIIPIKPTKVNPIKRSIQKNKTQLKNTNRNGTLFLI